ncbi:MAG TPA: LemA family protein, partial [Bacillota bacterium]|nr:LemA family protein [Bacillota bacterium]
VERYPDLKANEQFTGLRDELAGTENRLAVERRRYNELVQVYNTEIRRFPGSIIAGMMGLKAKDYFKAAETAKEAPKVNF